MTMVEVCCWGNDNEVLVTPATRRGQVYELHHTAANASMSAARNTACYCQVQLLELDAFQLLRHSAATAADSAPTESACVFPDQTFQDQLLEFDACHWLEVAARQDEPVFFCLFAALIFRLSCASTVRLLSFWV